MSPPVAAIHRVASLGCMAQTISHLVKHRAKTSAGLPWPNFIEINRVRDVLPVGFDGHFLIAE